VLFRGELLQNYYCFGSAIKGLVNNQGTTPFFLQFKNKYVTDVPNFSTCGILALRRYGVGIIFLIDKDLEL